MNVEVDNSKANTSAARVAQVVCFVLLCGILTAGLWPFHAPRNGAEWIEGAGGLVFQPYTTLVSTGAFGARSVAENSCTLKIIMSSGPGRKGTILAFADPAHPEAAFALRQMGSNLALQRYEVSADGQVTQPWLTVENVFDSGPVFITITGGKNGTRVYRNGVLAASASYFGMKRGDLTGRLVLGTSLRNDSWTGTIFGLAFSSIEMDRAEVASDRFGDASGNWDAIYRFDERSGNVAHNAIDSGTDLLIPSHYQVLEKPFLQRPWEQYRHTWSGAYHFSYWQDVIVNVAGFLPVGFCFAGLFCMIPDWRRPFAATAIFGFLLSLTIEVLQWFLPTRNSSLTDVLTNTLGTCLGLMLYRSTVGQIVWRQALSLGLAILGCEGPDSGSDDTVSLAA